MSLTQCTLLIWVSLYPVDIYFDIHWTVYNFNGISISRRSKSFIFPKSFSPTVSDWWVIVFFWFCEQNNQPCKWFPEYVPIAAYQKFNKLASFRSIEIAMKRKIRHVFTQISVNILVPVGWIEAKEIGKLCFLSSLAPIGHGFTVRFIGPFIELTLLYRLLSESYSPAVYFIFSNPRERMSDRINV